MFADANFSDTLSCTFTKSPTNYILLFNIHLVHDEN